MSRPDVPCRICGKPTLMIHTKLCDPCYEIVSRGGITAHEFRRLRKRHRAELAGSCLLIALALLAALFG